METSIFIARIFAVAYLAIGLGMLFNPAYYRKAIDEMMSPGVLYLGGIMALLAGYLIVSYHNVWESSWVVLITILGWLALVKGVLLLVFPKGMVDWTKSLLKNKNFMTLGPVVVLIIAVVLGYYGFFV